MLGYDGCQSLFPVCTSMRHGEIDGCQSLYPCIYMWPGRNWWLSFLIFLYIYETREILIVVNPCISVWPEENWWLLIHISLYICETREILLVAIPYIPVYLWNQGKIDGCQSLYPCISVRQEENWWLPSPISLYICETRGNIVGCHSLYPCIYMRPGGKLMVVNPYIPVYLWDQGKIDANFKVYLQNFFTLQREREFRTV